MDGFSEISLEFAQWLQSNYPQMEPFFGIFHEIGQFELYLILIVGIYWCLNKRLGASLAYLMTLSGAVNSLLKHAFRDPRPFWTNPEIGLEEELTYGVPSGHTQNATVFYGTLALWFRKSWVWLLSIIMIMLMSISRVYLGVHDIEDVLAGVIVGVLILVAFILWERFGEAWFMNRILGQRLLIAVLVPLLIGAVYVLIIILTAPAGNEVAWHPFIDDAEFESYNNMTLTIVGLLGLSVGLVLEKSRVRFLVDGPFWKRLARFLTGVIPVLILWFGIGRFFPKDPAWLEILLDAISFLLINLWISYYGPLFFTRIGLADRMPEPVSLISP